MQYKNEKDLLVDQIELLINRGMGCNSFPINARLEGNQLFSSEMTLLSNDSEIARLFAARQILIGEGTISSTVGSASSSSSSGCSSSQEVTRKDSVIDEFAKAYNFLVALRGEKDHWKAIAGLIEVGIFLITIVTALSSKEATRSQHNR